jgi:hypothetical protein
MFRSRGFFGLRVLIRCEWALSATALEKRYRQMRFNRPLVKLPVSLSAETLAREVTALPSRAWVAHPNAFPGNNAVRLITPGGRPTDELHGTMAPTEYLLACPYIMQVMGELGGTWGRSRLMGLAPGAEVPAHVDSHYYWRTHVRIHIPVITNPDVSFTCGGETVHMSEGECWVFDSFQRHEVHNRGSNHRVHLVLDTVGGPRLWDLIQRAQNEETESEPVMPGEGSIGRLEFESVNSPTIMSPWEMRCHIAFLAEEARPHPLLQAVTKRLERLTHEWGALWACYGTSHEGRPHYARLLSETGRDLGALDANDLLLKNDLPLYHVLGRLVFEVAIGAAPQAPAAVAPARSLAS